MPVLNFQDRFVGAVERGEKRQSIRATWRDGRFPFSPGSLLHLYTGLRTPAARKIATARIVSVDPVHISDHGVEIGADRERPNDLNAFARSDGFYSWEVMREWWMVTHGLPFDGWLLQWTYDFVDQEAE